MRKIRMSFEIAGTKVNQQEKKTGSIQMTELHDGTPVTISYHVINGAKPGPKLLVTAGHNGLNYNSIEAARMLCKLEPSKINGTLIVIPILNTPAFMLKSSRNAVEENTDLFNVFPGNKEGNVTQKIAYTITNEFFPKIDYYVHLMNGQLGGPRIDQVVFYPCPDELLYKEVELATAFGSEYMSDAHNKLTDRLEKRPNTVACRMGVPSIMSIYGESNTLEEKVVKRQYDGVLNVMKHYKMIPGKPNLPPGYTVYDTINFPRAEKSGFVHIKVDMGDRVKKGKLLAEIYDEFYNLEEKIYSEANGVITKIPKTPTVGTGERIGLQISINYCDRVSAEELYEISKNRPKTP
jgi:predicted deacylase